MVGLGNVGAPMIKKTDITPLVRRFSLGRPLETGALALPRVDGGVEVSSIPFFTHHVDGAGIRLRTTLEAHDRVFGLGQMLGAINRRGKRYRLFAKDDPLHTPDKSSLYGSHPFFILQGARTLGVFVDFPGEIVIDSGFTAKDTLEIALPRAEFDLYLFEHWDIREIIKQFLLLTGAPYTPPRWSFGYQQCRYSYPTAESIRSVAEQCREHGIPCDAIYMDIDYMKDYKIFTVDEDRFPDLPGLCQEMKKQGIKLIPIIDPGVKVERGDPTYESGLAGDHFCKAASGEPFVAAVWPGFVHLPDFLNTRCREWWGELYRPFVEMGIEHFWNDMNEPALFYTPESLSLLRQTIAKIRDTDDLGTGAVDFISSLGRFWQNEDDFRRFSHKLDDGREIPHDQVHNLYGASMALATAGGLRKLEPGQRYFLVVRSSYIGTHRHAVLWTGDNSSWWEHMLEHIRMMLSLNMTGFFFCGADVGGFGGDCSAELCVRWTQLGCFSPLFRNHSTKGSRSQEPWAFDAESLDIMREFIRLRYALLPYTYSEFLSSVKKLEPFISPLFLHFGDEVLKDIEDQFMFGESLMVAPVHTQAARSRFVYLPECRWLHWSARRFEEREMQVLLPGSHRVNADLRELPLFLRENSLIVMHPPAINADSPLPQSLEVVGFVTSSAHYTLVTDDGRSWDEAGNLSRIEIEVERKGATFTARARLFESPRAPLVVEALQLEIYDEQASPHRQTVQIQRTSAEPTSAE